MRAQVAGVMVALLSSACGHGPDSFAVQVAESVAPVDRDRILAELGRTPP